MDLVSIITLVKLLTGGGIFALILAYIHRFAAVKLERDRLIAEAKREKLKNDEKEITNKINSMPLDELVSNAPVIRSSDDPKRDD